MTEDEILSTELSDAADNELYIRYKVAKHEIKDLEHEAAHMKNLRKEMIDFKKGRRTQMKVRDLMA